jgi:CSLREA domain-containing protein
VPAIALLGVLGVPMLLADRAWAATYTVTTVADTVDPNDGHLSLREAILLANANSGLDTIIFNIDSGASPLRWRGNLLHCRQR